LSCAPPVYSHRYGLTDFKTLVGFRLSDPRTQLFLYLLTVLCLGGAYLFADGIVQSRTGKVLVAIRDSEQRVLFSGYSPTQYKLFVFVVSSGLAGTLYVPQPTQTERARIEEMLETVGLQGKARLRAGSGRMGRTVAGNRDGSVAGPATPACG
jgi:urea transport system permease protein